MKYTKVHIEAIGYELPPVVVTSDEIEERLEPFYRKLHLPEGALEALTGIGERRWWEPHHSLSRNAAAAAKKALAMSGVPAEALETVVLPMGMLGFRTGLQAWAAAVGVEPMEAAG